MAPKSNSPTKQDSSSTTPAKGQRYEVFSIKDREGKDPIWVRAGSAWVNRDGSLNVYLDVLPLDGKVQLRTPRPRPEGTTDAPTATLSDDIAF